ncbi:MAG: endonuclease/exonuclease/phosphatase family protein [Candidatus Lokiarchaeota archaeon]|nr:endonuclease/exonuclease/phosphatase family protein [Candidatus Lokiarchaeota archaeon]
MSFKYTKNFLSHFIVLSVLFIFFFQMLSDLIEAIYTMDLLNTTLDAKVLGIAFLFTTPLLFVFWKKVPNLFLKIIGLIVITFRLAEPFVRTPLKIILGGISVGSFLLFLPAYMVQMKNSESSIMGFLFSLSIGSSTLLILLFKTLNTSLDISMVGYTQSIGWILGIGAGIFLFSVKTPLITGEDPSLASKSNIPESPIRVKNKILGSITGLFSILMLLYFAYNSPAVFTRWFEINYFGAVITLSIVYVTAIGISVWKPHILANIKKLHLLIWNLIFFITLVVMIVLNQTSFINVNNGQVVIAYPTPWYLQILTYFNLILSPVLFLNIFMFIQNLYQVPMKNGRLIGSFLLNELVLVILIFALIFSNVWGYVEPISTYFRGLIWVPFAVIGLYTLLIIGLPKFAWNKNILDFKHPSNSFKSAISAVFLIVVVLNGVWAYMTLPHPVNVDGMGTTSLKIMTYNIQQGANNTGDKNFDAQLALIMEIDPDIIGLQESDTTKINTGNTDVVGYFAEKLDYYLYYGPKSVMQTYGCAILSRYPIQNFYSFYTYGDEDEIGSVFCEVVVGTRIFNVFVNHPAGSAEAKLAHTVAMLSLADELENVVLMGDFNWRENTPYYALVNASYVDTWRTKWPTGIDDLGLEMTSTIDHIFVSDTFSVLDARYIPEPESQTDHPAYWAEISW